MAAHFERRDKMTSMTKVMFYQNNPCVIVRDINDLFCEIQLNVQFAANMEADYYCTPGECRSPMSSGEAAEEEYEQVQAVIEDIQDEEHSILCMVEKRLLHDDPIEATTINSLQKEITSLSEEFSKLRELHAEWVASIKAIKQQKAALNLEITSLNLSRNAILNIRKTAEAGIDRLSERYGNMVVEIQKYSVKQRSISQDEYDRLVSRDNKLDALERGGVDNWEWYEESLGKAGL